MTINANTKIAPILKQNPKALDAIVSISTKFEKLRNPILRKVMAGRTTLTAASKLGGCTVDDFFAKLEPLGFEIDRNTKAVEEAKKPVPDFITSLKKDHLQAGTALFVYHKRIPVFLLPELAQRGLDYRIKEIKDGEVHLLIFENNGSNNK